MREILLLYLTSMLMYLKLQMWSVKLRNLVFVGTSLLSLHEIMNIVQYFINAMMFWMDFFFHVFVWSLLVIPFPVILTCWMWPKVQTITIPFCTNFYAFRKQFFMYKIKEYSFLLIILYSNHIMVFFNFNFMCYLLYNCYVYLQANKNYAKIWNVFHNECSFLYYFLE
jgi:hypothetical protein